MTATKHVAALAVLGSWVLASCSGSPLAAAPTPLQRPTPTATAALLTAPRPQPQPSSTSYALRAVQLFFPAGDRLASKPVMVGADHPLHDAIQKLLNGPGSPRYFSEIPPGARLLDVSLRQKIAYADFNHAFFGPGGPLGIEIRLGQVVFTLTQFRRVQAVQFLVDGQIQAMTGSEGYPIGHPFTRKDFPYIGA